MGAFFNGFVITLLALVITMVFIIFYYFKKNERQKKLLYDLSQAKVEPTVWINTLISRILTHFRTERAIQYINEKVSERLGSNFKFNLLTVGEDIKVSPVSTIHEEGKVPSLFITFTWEHGVSCDLEKQTDLKGEIISRRESRTRIEADIRKFVLTSKIHWRDENTILLNFFYPSKIDFDICIDVFGKWKLCPTRFPIFGQFIKNMIVFVLTSIEIPIELPNIENCNNKESKNLMNRKNKSKQNK